MRDQKSLEFCVSGYFILYDIRIRYGPLFGFKSNNTRRKPKGY